MFSGVPLNNSTGGLNPYAVEHGLQLGARLVWMPTFSAANHIRQGHRHTILPTKSKMLPPTALTVVTDRGELKDEVKQILDLIAANDAVLSGGHLHISEMWPLFEEAKARGVTRMLVNHPTFVIDASVADVGGPGAHGRVDRALVLHVHQRALFQVLHRPGSEGTDHGGRRRPHHPGLRPRPDQQPQAGGELPVGHPAPVWVWATARTTSAR